MRKNRISMDTIAASPGWNILRLLPVDTSFDVYPVAAWRIEHYEDSHGVYSVPSPICPTSPGDLRQVEYLTECPNGEVSDEDNYIWPDRDQALRDLLAARTITRGRTA